MAVERFLRDISNEIGFKLGSPWRYNDKSLGVIVPILKTGIAEEREYITLEEAKDQGIIFKDSGHINRVIIESSLGVPIFIRSGTMLKSGGTQPRAVESSIIIIPDKMPEGAVAPKIPITIREISTKCIYSSKSIRGGEKFAYGGQVPIEVRSALMAKRGQNATWNAVDGSVHRFMASNATLGMGIRKGIRERRLAVDNLVGVMEEVDKFTSNVDEILKNIPLFEDQVGTVFLDMKDVVGLEMFDHPKSWEAIHKDVEKRFGESATKEQESFYAPDYSKVKPLVSDFLKKLIESKKTEASSEGLVSTVTLKGDGIIGEATMLHGKVIHMVGIREDKKVEDKKVEDNIRTARDIFRNIGNTTIR